MREAPRQDRRELIKVGGLERGEARLADPDQPGHDRLMGPSLGSEGQARGSRDQDKPRSLVAGVVQGVETAANKRVVKRADRQQSGTEEGSREAQGRQQQKQVIFGDPKLDV